MEQHHTYIITWSIYGEKFRTVLQRYWTLMLIMVTKSFLRPIAESGAPVSQQCDISSQSEHVATMAVGRELTKLGVWTKAQQLEL